MKTRFMIVDGTEYYSEHEFAALEAELKQAKAKLGTVTEECRKNELRHGEMIESLVNALARYDGNEELLKDARTYLSIIFEGHESVKAYTDYKEWHRQRMDEYQAYLQASAKQYEDKLKKAEKGE